MKPPFALHPSSSFSFFSFFLLPLLLLLAFSQPFTQGEILNKFIAGTNLYPAPPTAVAYAGDVVLASVGDNNVAINVKNGEQVLPTTNAVCATGYNGDVYFIRSISMGVFNWDDGLNFFTTYFYDVADNSMVSNSDGIFWYENPARMPTVLYWSQGQDSNTKSFSNSPNFIQQLSIMDDGMYVQYSGGIARFNNSLGGLDTMVTYCNKTSGSGITLTSLCKASTSLVATPNYKFFIQNETVWSFSSAAGSGALFCNIPLCATTPFIMTFGSTVAVFGIATGYTSLYTTPDSSASFNLVYQWTDNTTYITAVPNPWTTVDNILYFLMRNTITTDCVYLWQTDGTTKNTKLVTTYCNSTGDNPFNAGFLKAFVYTLSDQQYIAFTFQTVIGTVSKAVSVDFQLFDLDGNSLTYLGNICTSCSGKVDTSYYTPGLVYYFTTDGLYIMTYGPNALTSAGLNLSPSGNNLLTFLVACLLIRFWF